MSFDPKKLSSYPTKPGVYLMKNMQEKVLYVGKAKNLKNRLKQYFSKNKDNRITIDLLIPQVHSIDTIVVTTEKEALILENTLIKKYKPKYNILLKDDKTYISLMLTKHKWPMLKIVRKPKKNDNNVYFGPYTNAKAARQTLDLINRLFPLRQCSDSELANRSRPCILYEIKRCLAPCVGKCTKKQYDNNVNHVIKLLKGKDKLLLLELKSKMKEKAEKLEFEQANEILQTINQIKHITQMQHVANIEKKDSDILGFFQKNNKATIFILQIRDKKLSGSHHFEFSNIISTNEELFENFLMQNYQIGKLIPSNILLPFSIDNGKAIEDVLSKKANRNIHISIPKKGKKKELLNIANMNAKALFLQEIDNKEKLLLEMQEKFFIKYPKYIECIDTSNISGENAVASIVGFTDGKRDKSLTKLFKMKTEEKGDCPHIRHTLFRHFSKMKENNTFCDLLIVDGGKAQLNAAIDTLKLLDIAPVDVIAITKEKSRHDKGLTQERIYLPNKPQPIILPINSELLFFLQHIRDEAHRVAIGFHRKRREKKLISSELDKIHGIGPKKRKLLLAHFKSIDKIKRAKIKELMQVKSITKKDIKNLQRFFNPLNSDEDSE